MRLILKMDSDIDVDAEIEQRMASLTEEEWKAIEARFALYKGRLIQWMREDQIMKPGGPRALNVMLGRAYLRGLQRMSNYLSKH